MLKKFHTHQPIKQVAPLTPKQQKSLGVSAIVVWIIYATLIIWVFDYGLLPKIVFLMCATVCCLSTAIYAFANHKLSDKQRRRWQYINTLFALMYVLIFILMPRN